MGNKVRRDSIRAAGIIATVVTVAVYLWVILLTGAGPKSDLLQILNGPFVAIHGVLLASCLPPGRRFVPMVLFASLGLTHLLWLIAVLMLIERIFGNATSTTLGIVQLFGVTGIVLAGPLLVAARHWWPALSMGAAITIAVLLVSSGMWVHHGVNGVAIGAAPLHLAIVWTMFAIIVRAKYPSPEDTCQNCQYPLAGLRQTTTICPECGTPTSEGRPATSQ